METNKKLMEQLVKEALYAQKSYSIELIHQTYGEAKMAYMLDAIDKREFLQIMHMTVTFSQTDHDFIAKAQ